MYKQKQKWRLKVKQNVFKNVLKYFKNYKWNT